MICHLSVAFQSGLQFWVLCEVACQDVFHRPSFGARVGGITARTVGLFGRGTIHYSVGANRKIGQASPIAVARNFELVAGGVENDARPEGGGGTKRRLRCRS